MALKLAALLILVAWSGRATSDGQERLERSAVPQEISPRILDTYLKPPPQQGAPVTPAPLPFMQRIARWFLTSDPPANQRPFYSAPRPQHAAPQKVPPQVPVKQDCRPCNKIPWIPMFPIKEAITDAVLSLVSGQSSGGGGDAVRPKDPPLEALRPPRPQGSSIAPPKYPPSSQTHFSLPPRPVNVPSRPPPPPPPPPSPYKVPLPYGNQKPIVSYLSPPLNRPSVYGQMRPYLPFGYLPQKEEITFTIHENKNRPNAIYSIPGGPQIHLMTDPRPSAGGAQPPRPPKIHAEVVPSVPIADYLSSIEYPMVYGPSHMMDLTKETSSKPVEGEGIHGGHIHYGQPHKDTGIIGPLPQHFNASHQPSSGYEDVHQGGPAGGLNSVQYQSQGPQHSSSGHQYSSPAPPQTGYSSPSPLLSTATPKIYTSTHSPNDNPTVSSTLGAISTERSSTVSPFSPALDSTTRASIISSTYSIPTGSSTEGPKFSNSFSPPTSTYVDIQPSLQTAEYLSSLPQNGFRVHPGQGFRLSDGFPFNANLGHPFHTPQKQTHGDLKGHFITKHPYSPTHPPHLRRPSPAPFQPPKGEQIRHPVSLAPNPALWTKDHPYSFQIPPTDVSQNHDALSTGSGQAQVPTKDHHFLEEPPIYSFIHNANGGHLPNQQDNWRYESGKGSFEDGPSTIKQVSSTPYFGHSPTPFSTSTTPTPPVLIPNSAYSASTASPKFSKDGQTKNKKTKQVQIIIPYITGGHEAAASKETDEGHHHGFFNWHQREEDYHDHQESRTVTASALHPNLLANNNTNLENDEEGKYQHVLAPDLKNLLQAEVDERTSENPLLRLQKNIDAWTVEQFSKKPNSVTNDEGLTTKSVRFLEDHEVSGSHEHVETVRLESSSTVRPRSTSKSTASTFWGIQSNLVVPESKKNESREDVQGFKAEEPTSTTANWSKTQVAISPTTKEKVYVVTPMTWGEATTESSAKLQTTHRGVTNTFTSPRFLIRPTPGGKTEIFVTTTTDASVRENAADVSSNDVFLPSERARHKASEGSFFGGTAVPTPSYTLLPGTQVRTFAGHSRVVTSVSAPTYSYSLGKSTPAPPASSAEDARTSSRRRVDVERISDDIADVEGVVVELDPS